MAKKPPAPSSDFPEEFLASLTAPKSSPSDTAPVSVVANSGSAPSQTAARQGILTEHLPPVTIHGLARFLLENPSVHRDQLPNFFSFKASALTSILASDAFQTAIDPIRHLLDDPSLSATLTERYRALAIRSTDILMTKLEDPKAADFLILKGAELSIKALSSGGKLLEGPANKEPEVPEMSLAERLLSALDSHDKKRTVPEDVEDAQILPPTDF